MDLLMKEIINLGSYIWKVAYTTTCNIMEKKSKHSTVSIDDITFEQHMIIDEGENQEQVSIDLQYHRDKLLDIIEKSVDSLLDSRRHVIKLYLLGMSKKEIAEFLGWTQDKVRNLLYRGFKDLKTILEKNGIQSFL